EDVRQPRVLWRDYRRSRRAVLVSRNDRSNSQWELSSPRWLSIQQGWNSTRSRRPASDAGLGLLGGQSAPRRKVSVAGRRTLSRRDRSSANIGWPWKLGRQRAEALT